MSLSIRQYAISFALVTLLLIAGFAYKTHEDFQDTRHNIISSHELAAKNELSSAINKSISTLNKNIQNLTNWEEIHQQLNTPSYFSYWYNNRLNKGTKEVPNFISDLMLYNNQGIALTQISQSLLPHQLKDTPQNAHYFVKSKNDLVITVPVFDEDNRNRIGFLSVQINFIKLIRDKTNFYFIRPKSLSLNPKNENKLLMNIEKETINFEITKTPNFILLEQQLTTATNQLILLVILPALILYGLLVYILTIPVNGISQYLHKIRTDPDSDHQYQYRALFKVKELKEILTSLKQYHTELFNSHAVLDEKNKDLWLQAHHDALTGAYNRRAFDDQWKNLNDLLAEHRVDVSFLLFDVNLFKSINDTYGHQVGDKVLTGISKCIMKSLRKGEHLFRLGGDEFASFLIDSDIQIAVDVAERCIKAIAEYPFSEIGMPEPVRVSIGISQSSSHQEDSFDKLQWQADTAMYEAKRPGNKDVVVFHNDLTDNSKGLLSSWLSNTVYQAIDKGTGIVLYYQPIVDFHENKISYFEALVRIHNDGELISPTSIFTIVEARHFEIELDRAVIKKLLSDLSKQKIPTGTGVSLNLSGPTLTNSKILDWITPLQSYAKQYKIVIEITETALITELKRVTAHLKSMQKMGFTIALDDFGSGYSSIKYLASMPVDIVKFDITLVRSLLDGKQRRMITRLAQMIEEVGHKLVAEGIEDQTLLNHVLGTGFHFGQGYLFGRPQENPIQQYQLEESIFAHHPSYRQLSLH